VDSVRFERGLVLSLGVGVVSQVRETNFTVLIHEHVKNCKLNCTVIDFWYRRWKI